MRRPDRRAKRLPAVDGLEELDVQDVDRVGALRVGDDVRVVPGPLAELVLVVDARPLLAAVVRPEEAPLLRLDDRADAVRPRGRDRDADLPDDRLPAGRRPASSTCRRRPSTSRGRSPGRRSRDGPRLASRPARSRRRGRAGSTGRSTRSLAPVVVVDEEDLLPGLPAVLSTGRSRGPGSGPTCARARRPRRRRGSSGGRRRPRSAAWPRGRRSSSVFPASVDFQTPSPREVFPRMQRLAHPGVDHVRVRLRDRDRADGARLEELVRDRLPARAAVRRLPDAAPGRCRSRT